MSDEKIILNKKKGNQKRLGMGLSALLGAMEDVDIFSSNLEQGNQGNLLNVSGYTNISINNIVPNPAQPRKVFAEDELLELSNSIAQNGVLQPILVRKVGETFQIIAGERRFRASKLAGLKEIPCIVKDLSDEQVFILSIVENIQREDLNPLEEAESYHKLIKEFGYKQEEVAELMGKSRSHIANLIRLIKLPESLKALVLGGKLTGSHVRPLLALKTEEQMIDVANIVIENNYTVRKVEELVNQILKDDEEPQFKSITEDDATRLEERLIKIKKEISVKQEISHLIEGIIASFSNKFQKAEIKIKPSKKGGMISIKYKNEEELAKIMKNIVDVQHKHQNNVISIPGKEDFATIEIV
jgi:ParB family chromosome partitioning protein